MSTKIFPLEIQTVLVDIPKRDIDLSMWTIEPVQDLQTDLGHLDEFLESFGVEPATKRKVLSSR